MKKAIAISSAEFEAQAKKLVSLAFALCENRKKANKYNSSPELRALTTAALSLEQAISTFLATERLVTTKKTKPAAIFTEASLIRELENVALAVRPPMRRS